ncbi:MAG: cytochrome P450 [Bacteroidota bacterium]
MSKKAPLYTGNSWLGAVSEVQDTPLELYPRIHQQLGPVVRVKLIPFMEMISVASPEAMEHVLRKHQNNYPKPSVFTRALSPLTGRGLITNETHNWATQRKLMGPSFHHRQIARMVHIMAEDTMSMAEIWRKQDGQIRDVLEDMMFLTLNIVSRALFSTDVMSGAGTISVAVRDAFAYAGYRLKTPFSLGELLTGRRKRAFKQAKRLLDDTIADMIGQRLESGEVGEDMLGLLLAARDEETGKGMDTLQLRDELMTLMIAGHETTAAALSWSFYLLAKHPETWKKLQAAADGFTLPDISDTIRFDIPDYAKWVFEESMRLYPPAWGVPRESLEVDEIHGFHIPKKTVINCSLYAMFRDPQIWEEPEAFKPERFADSQVAERPRYASIPFGLGKRQCIGMNMALVEGPLILTLLAQQVQLHLPEGTEKVSVDATFALRPQDSLEMRIEKRK